MSEVSYRTEKIKSGTPIVTEDTWAYYVYVLLSGKAKVVKSIEGVQETIATIKEGDVIGEMSIVGGAKRTASVIADGDVEVAMISRDAVLDIIRTLSDEMKEELTTLTSDLTHVSYITANLMHQLRDLERLKAKHVDIKSFTKHMADETKDLPDIYKQVFATLAIRLNNGIENLTKLSLQVENVASHIE